MYPLFIRLWLCVETALVIIFVFTTAGDTAYAQAPARGGPREVVVGIVTDGPAANDEVLIAAFAQQVRELGGEKYRIVMPKDKVIEGLFDGDTIAAGLSQLMGDREVDLVYALGPLASHVAGRIPRLSKPVIAPFVIDRALQNMPFFQGKSGRKNLNYLDWPWSVSRDLQIFREVAAPERAVFLVPQYLITAIPELTDRAGAAAQEAGVPMSIIAVDDSATAAIEAIDALSDSGTPIDGAYLSPLPQLTAAETDALVSALTARRIPTFSVSGEHMVKRGVLMARRPDAGFARLVRRVGLHTMRIVDGEDAGQLPVALRLPERVFINMQTARAIGLSPSWRVLTEAELIAPQRAGQQAPQRTVNLASVIEEALAGNVDIQALEQVVIAGRASVRTARAQLLPQLSASATARLIDRDRAEAALGSAPRVLATGEINLSQVVYADAAWAGYSAETQLQKSREEQLRQARWDIAAQVGIAYLNLLRAKTAERIRRDSLKQSRANLALARIRVDAGSANRAEVHRWEAEIARERKATIEAAAQRNLAEIDLQRILNRPPEERFATEDTELAAQFEQAVLPLVGDPQSFRHFRAFMIQEALERAPEMGQIDAAIAAQERILRSAQRSLYAPTVALQANGSQRLYKGGAGSDSLPGSNLDGLEWFVGVSLSVPLFEGGARYAEIERNRAEVARLMRQRSATRNQIAQRAAAQLHLAGASFAGIGLSRDGTNAAEKNYQLVAAAYREGAVRIIDLLDAQNAWVTAEEVAADAVYDFMIDWLNVQRAVGRFDVLMSGAESAAFLDRARAYIAARK